MEGGERGQELGSGSGSSWGALGEGPPAGRSSRREMQRLKSGKGEEVRALMRMLITTSGL